MNRDNKEIIVNNKKYRIKLNRKSRRDLKRELKDKMYNYKDYDENEE
ncbi:MAG: hypothetical protein AABY22_05155 [Nanoarchaeota archaeon]